jgi:sodium/hydrogen antiporter
LITVESGLNDGIVTPVVMLALAGAASARGPGDSGLWQALLTLEELGPAAAGALSIIGLTVLLSVVAHGFTARPLSSCFGRTVPADGRPTRTEQA